MKRIWLSFLLTCGILIGMACRGEQQEPSATPAAATVTVPPAPIGSVSRVEDQVEHGPEGGLLSSVTDEAEDLHADDRVGVRDGGEALLDFGNALRVILFNNSETTVATRAAEDTPLIVHFVLWRGGLIGEKELSDARQVELDTPAGAKVTVVGTTFFVTYDANSEVTTVGNFGGTVTVTSGGASRTVANNSYVIAEPDRPPGPAQPLLLDADGFAERARALNTPLAVVDELQAGPTATPRPRPTATDTPAPVLPTATFTVDANCWRGPGRIYEVLRVIPAGTRLRVTGRNPQASWWQLDAGRFTCWAVDSVLAVENGFLVEAVRTPIPPTFTPTPAPPDLVINSIEITGGYSRNNQGDFELPLRVSVANSGGLPAEPFKISVDYRRPDLPWFLAPFTVPGQANIWYPFTAEPLPGQSEIVFEGIVTIPEAADGETILLRAVADSCAGDEFMPAFCRVEESAEKNNESKPITYTLPFIVD